jgi:hypothetical protein
LSECTFELKLVNLEMTVLPVVGFHIKRSTASLNSPLRALYVTQNSSIPTVSCVEVSVSEGRTVLPLVPSTTSLSLHIKSMLGELAPSARLIGQSNFLLTNQ